ncbi:tetratricopeptide repeat protein [Streptomyces sp. NPDC001910]|uniref:tetratricopeptide repeat protein n=1 Tax=Streptomyces sp. NPDC001910 TaxID=3154403 RepID=UPI00331E3152
MRDPQHPVRGREAVLQRLEADLARSGGERISVLCGMGGCGKTALAVEVAASRLRGGWRVWWVDGQRGTSLEAGMRAVARQAGASEEELRNADTTDVVWAYLERLRDRWLLVVDNADDAALLDGPGRLSAGTGWVRPLALGRGNGAVLVTSRDSTAAVWGPASRLYPVHPLTGDHLDDAAHILQDHAHSSAGTHGEARELARRLGGLPLTLRLAGTYLASVHQTPGAFRPCGTPSTYVDYQRVWENEVERLDSDRLLARTLALTVELLEERGQTHARSLLELITAFGDAELPYSLLLTPERLAPAPGGLSTLNGSAVWEHLAGLAAFGLVDLRGPSVGDLPVLQLHPLVRDACRNPALLSTAVAVLHSAARAAETGTPQEPEFWMHWRLLTPHLLDVFHRAVSEQLPGQIRLAAATSAGLAAQYLRTRGLHGQARSEFEAVLAVFRDQLGDGHQDTLTTRHELARVLREQGELPEARQEFEAILALRRAHLGDGHDDTLTTRHELGRVLREQGELPQARQEFEAILAQRRTQLGNTHDQTLTTRHELARILHDQGDLQAAGTEFEAVLAERREQLGEVHPSTLASRHNLARVLHSRGDLVRARSEFEAILDLERELRGDSYPGTLDTRHDLARVMQDQGELEAARAEFEVVLALRRERLGATHPHTLDTQHQLARMPGPEGGPETEPDVG